jgi:hypothetical protein
LKHHIIQKRIEYFKAFNEESEDQCLMQTIRIPKNLLFLSDKLPQPNYGGKINNSGELPEIRQLNQKRKPKNREVLQENIENSSIAGEPQIASIKKKNAREVSNIENGIQLKNSNNEEEAISIKLIDKREKSPSG